AAPRQLHSFPARRSSDLVWSSAVRAGPPRGLTVVFFDVGQGDAALVRSPGGASILIDGGPDPLEVSVKLAALGVRRLDLMVATQDRKSTRLNSSHLGISY